MNNKIFSTFGERLATYTAYVLVAVDVINYAVNRYNELKNPVGYNQHDYSAKPEHVQNDSGNED